jgi:hypothetical protein
MRIDEAHDMLASIGLCDGDYAVFGSGPLLVRGVVDEVNDIDVISRGAAWETAAASGELVFLPEHGVTVASFFAGRLTVGTSWAIGNVDINDAIDTAEVIGGIPYVRLDLVVAYKEIASRPKDIEHLHLLEMWLESGRH